MKYFKIKIIAILMALSVGAFAENTVYTTANGTTVEVQPSTDTHTRIKTITIPSTDGGPPTVIVRGGNEKDTGAPWHNYSTNPKDWDRDGDGIADGSDNANVTITVVHEYSDTRGTSAVVQAAAATIIQPTMITSIGGGMSGGGGETSTSVPGQAIDVEDTIVLEDSSWIEEGVAFWN